MSDLRFPHKVIRASAGTGKTHQLTNRYLALVCAGQPAHQLLATTFTRKAAGEILDRVLFRLAAAARQPDKLAELARALPARRLSRSDCLRMLEHLTRNLHRLRVGTLDSFFAQIARGFALELGLPPGWQIVEESVEARLRAEAIERLLRAEAAGELLTLMHLLTKGDAQRTVAQLVHETVAELYDIFQQSPAEAWRRVERPARLSSQQLGEAVASLEEVPLPDDRVWTRARQTAVEQARAGDWEGFISSGIAAKILDGRDEFHKKPIEAPVRRAYERVLEHARAELLHRLANQTEATRRLLEKFDEHFQRLKQRERALRFEDITGHLARLSEPVEIGRVAFRLDGQVAHLLLDEFQDTSLAQWRVIGPFARAIGRGGPGKSLFCVGDAKQAIYGWRGGVSELFDAVDQHVDALTTEQLDESYRSAQPVIDTVNRLFSRLDRHPNLKDLAPAVAEWCAKFHEHKTVRTELAGYACVVTARAADPGEKQPEVTLQWAARHVVRLAQQAPDRSVGVLVRRNQSVAALINHLRRLGINASQEGGNPLTDSAAVQLLLSLMQLADHPGDLVARFHLAHSPLAEPLGLASHEDAAAACRCSQRVRRALADDGYGPTIWGFANELVGACDRRELGRLEQLVALAYSYEPMATLRPGDFVRHVQSQRVADPSAARVRVMTIHQAKGLQFDIVVLAELDADLLGQRPPVVSGRPSPTEPIDRVCRYVNTNVQKLLPAGLRQMFAEAERRAVAEALCVLYVAVTRAVHALHMIIAPADSQTVRRSYAGLLRASLADGRPLPPETVGYELGDPCWFQERAVSRAQAEAPPKPPDGGPPAELAVRLKPIAGPRRRALERKSPSRLEGARQVRVADLLSDEGAPARTRGTVIHAWFEQIKWLDDGRPDEAALRSAASKLADLALPPSRLDGLLAEFYAMLDQPEVRRTLSRARYAPAGDQSVDLRVHTEQPIAFYEGDELIAGNIDRLVLTWEGDKLLAAEIIDFKTDALRADRREAIQSKAEYYRPQLEAYRRAVARIYRLEPSCIAARLLFVSPGLAVPV